MENDKTKSENSHLEVVSTSQDAERGDVGLAVFSRKEDLASAIDPVVERKLIRKIDMFVVPFICVTYLVTYIDKATLGYAAVFGLQTDLHLHGSQYSWLGKLTAQVLQAFHLLSYVDNRKYLLLRLLGGRFRVHAP